ncbi:MAG: heavy metal translocating P-type ATPase, partial [Clostridiales Family XIII bacterium]|nr:heavy metal translocating P-type ATPase [Clostridiales Family XIII bacterium]
DAAEQGVVTGQANAGQGVVSEVAAEDVAVGQIIEIRPGGRIPLDATIISGSGEIDMMALTGETLPVDVHPGSDILAGAVNGSALLRARVTKPFAESTASKIIELAQNASARKAPAENFITRFARVYTPIVVIIAACLAILPPLFGVGAWPDWIMRGLVFLVVSCPCALVISIPVSYFGGIGYASSQGILVKGGNYLDTLGRIRAVVFDKTGTLTKGKFKVTEMRPADGFSGRETLAYAAAAESASTHPIAVSILDEYRNIQGGAPAPVTDIVEKAGYGVSAVLNGETVLCGNAKLMEAEGVAYEVPDGTGTAVYIAAGGKYAGAIVVADEIKPDSAAAIAGLKARGIDRIVMLTGDAPDVAAAVGASLGIEEVHAGLLPQQKVEILEQIIEGRSANPAAEGNSSEAAPDGNKASAGSVAVAGDCISEASPGSVAVAGDRISEASAGSVAVAGDRISEASPGSVAVVGDGINDAPMLARADVGIAMGGLGSDAAVEAADVVIMNDAPSKVMTAVDVAHKTKRIVIQNIALALGIKGAVLLLAALGIANMWEAVFADVGVALLAVLNAMRAGK